MKYRTLVASCAVATSAAVVVVLGGCAARHSTPVEPLAHSRASIESAEAIGAAEDPQAAVHLRLAKLQVAEAMDLIEHGDSERAAWVLRRAITDADLASALARENSTRAEAQQAAEQAERMRRADRRGKRTE